MDRFLSLDSLGELGWGIEIFLVVTTTLMVRFTAMYVLKILGRRLENTENEVSPLDIRFEIASKRKNYKKPPKP